MTLAGASTLSPNLVASPDDAATVGLAKSLQDRRGPFASNNDPSEPSDMPGYLILGELGRGGMGVVYKARQQSLKRLVALKMIRAGIQADPDELNRFRIEALAIARLQHPNIVQVFEVGDRHGCPYFSLEYCGGGSLAERLKKSPLSFREAAGLVETLARAMASAHDHGIVHRDLKPGNVLYLDDGTPKITDFGLAKRLDDDSAQTQTGAILGTPSYMAPEQAEGRTHLIGPASDLYALGAILYECVAGRPPFQAATPLDAVLQVINNQPVSPRQLQPMMPRDLETICLTCLHKEPARRYRNASALADDLERFLNDQPILARPSSWLEKSWRWCRRKPLVAGLLALALTLTVAMVGVGVIAYLSTRASLDRENKQRLLAEDEKRNAQKARAEAEQARDDAVAQRDVNARNLYVANMRLGYEMLQHRHLSKLDGLLAQYTSNNPQHALAGWEWCYLRGACREEALAEHQLMVTSNLAWNRHASIWAAGDGEGVVHISNNQRGEKRHRLAAHRGAVYALAYSADGKYLASAGIDATIKIWDPEAGKLLATWPAHQGAINALTFHPDGDRLASAGGDGKVCVWDRAAKQVKFTLLHGGLVRSVAWSPDGQWLASVGDNFWLKVWNPAAGGLPVASLVDREPIFSVDWSPDSQKVALQGWGGVTVWHRPSQQRLYARDTVGWGGRPVRWSPDGQSLAVGCDDCSVRIVAATDGQLKRILRNHSASIYSVAWADNERLATSSADKTVRLHNVAATDGLTTFAAHNKAIWALAWSPDGAKLATGGEDKALKVWDLRTSKELWSDALPGLIRDLAWRRKGERLAVCSYNGGTRVYDVDQGKLLNQLPGTTQWQSSADWNKQGARLASYGWDGKVMIFNAESGQLTREFTTPSGRGDSLAFSPDGRLLATGGQSTDVKIWEAESARLHRKLPGHLALVTGLTWSPDGSLVAVGCGDGVIKVWDVEQAKVVATLSGHTGLVFRLGWNGPGRRLASASFDQTVKIWDVDTSQEILTLYPRFGPVLALAWSPDGQRLAAGGGDGKITIWNATLGFQEFSPQKFSPQRTQRNAEK